MSIIFRYVLNQPFILDILFRTIYTLSFVIILKFVQYHFLEDILKNISHTVINTWDSYSIFIFIRKYWTCGCYILSCQVIVSFQKMNRFLRHYHFYRDYFLLSSFLKIVRYLGKSIPRDSRKFRQIQFPLLCYKRPTTSNFIQHNNISFAIPNIQTESFLPHCALL